MNETHSNRVELSLAGAKPKVEVDGALGIVAKVLVDGKRARPDRGGWIVPLKKGGEGRLSMKGFLPGFQRIRWEGEEVFALGSHVGLAERIVIFVPFVLFLMAWYLVPVSLALFFMSIPVVKNVHMPRALRIALPVINTLAVGVAVIAIAALVYQ
ncbi:MAG: hypothetical protein CVT68_09460 [Actinobacteria bacterium HGW-Actinobacteria-8]|nr:MAG: hypothetical protein CVT68_09460 [Actinobacteria bacterium HGW-Actinobacteria-8]